MQEAKKEEAGGGNKNGQNKFLTPPTLKAVLYLQLQVELCSGRFGMRKECLIMPEIIRYCSSSWIQMIQMYHTWNGCLIQIISSFFKSQNLAVPGALRKWRRRWLFWKRTSPCFETWGVSMFSPEALPYNPSLDAWWCMMMHDDAWWCMMMHDMMMYESGSVDGL